MKTVRNWGSIVDYYVPKGGDGSPDSNKGPLLEDSVLIVISKKSRL